QAPEDALARIDGREAGTRRSEECLDLAEHEESARGKRAVERLEQPFLRLTVEVDEDVPATDKVESVTVADGRRSVLEQVTPLETDEFCDRRCDRERCDVGEVPFAELVGRFGKIAVEEFSALGGGETRPIDIRSQYLDTPDLREHTAERRVAMEEDRERIRFFSRRASGAP